MQAGQTSWQHLLSLMSSWASPSSPQGLHCLLSSHPSWGEQAVTSPLMIWRPCHPSMNSWCRSELWRKPFQEEKNGNDTKDSAHPICPSPNLEWITTVHKVHLATLFYSKGCGLWVFFFFFCQCNVGWFLCYDKQSCCILPKEIMLMNINKSTWC